MRSSPVSGLSFVCHVFSSLLVNSWDACGVFKEFKDTRTQAGTDETFFPGCSQIRRINPAPPAPGWCLVRLLWICKRVFLWENSRFIPDISAGDTTAHRAFSPPVGRCRRNGNVSKLRPQKNPPVALSFTWYSSTPTEQSQHGR